MRGIRLDRILAGTALALVLTAPAAFAGTAPESDDAGSIELRIPVPQPADVKPPTSADLGLPGTNSDSEQSRGKSQTAAPSVTRAATPAVTAVRDAAPEKPATTGAPGASSTDSAAALPHDPPGETAVTGAVPQPARTAPAALSSPRPAATAELSPAAVSPPADTQGTPPRNAGKDSGSKDTNTKDGTPKDAVKPLADSLAAADIPIAEKLREMVPARLDRILDRKKEKQAVEAFYAGRGFAPLWIENGAPSDRANAVIARLKGADADGLDPADYATPDFAAAADHPDLLAESELKLTNAVLSYARHAQIGRVHFSRISADIYYDQVVPEPADILSKMAQAKDAGEALGSYNPPQEGFKALRAKLAEARSGTGDSRPARIPGGPTLKAGMRDDRVPLLRERLGLPGGADDKTYDKPLVEAVKKFQREHDLSATGSFNGATVEALNGPRRDRDADIIIANMERWRWLPRDLGKTHVEVNLPDYTLKVMHNGATAWRTRIVVGKPSTPTPLLSETMKYITVNPTWNVPPSIVYNEYLPVLQQDPDALSRIGLRVEQERDGSIHISQPPGDGNALGRIRFNFPNKFLVYQHDTPDKHLFAREKRAYSHGCMRVQDPLKYGEVLLSFAAPNEGYTAERLHRMFGSEEHDINLPTPIPVHITYQTAFVNEAGKLEIRDDIYGRDARILAALKGDERRIADVPIEHRANGVHHQAIRLPPRGWSFFEQLFR